MLLAVMLIKPQFAPEIKERVVNIYKAVLERV